MHSPIDSRVSQEQSLTVELICDEQCIANAMQAGSAAPTGAEILQGAGRPATPDQLVLQILRRGGLESIRLEERADLSLGSKFVLSAGDRTYRFTVGEKQYECPTGSSPVSSCTNCPGLARTNRSSASARVLR